MGSLPTSTNNRALDMDLPRRFHSELYITIGRNSARRSCLCEWWCIQDSDIPSSRFPRRICDDLQVSGDEPILVNGVVVFC